MRKYFAADPGFVFQTTFLCKVYCAVQRMEKTHILLLMLGIALAAYTRRPTASAQPEPPATIRIRPITPTKEDPMREERFVEAPVTVESVEAFIAKTSPQPPAVQMEELRTRIATLLSSNRITRVSTELAPNQSRLQLRLEVAPDAPDKPATTMVYDVDHNTLAVEAIVIRFQDINTLALAVKALVGSNKPNLLPLARFAHALQPTSLTLYKQVSGELVRVEFVGVHARRVLHMQQTYRYPRSDLDLVDAERSYKVCLWFNTSTSQITATGWG